MNTVGVSLFELFQVRTMNFPLVTADYASFLLASGPPSSVCVCDDYKYVLPYCPQRRSPQVTQELDCPSPPGTGSQGRARL